MKNLEPYIIIFLGIGWLLARRRVGFWARAIIMGSIPVGGFFGGYIVAWICSLALHAQGKGNSHNDLFAIAAAWVLGMIIGGIGSATIAFFMTRQKVDKGR